jgi:hypothetical protein
LNNRPYKELSNKYFVKLKERFNQINYTPKTSDEYSSLINTALYNLHVHLTLHDGSLDDIKTRKSSTQRGWDTALSQIQTDHKTLLILYEFMKDEEKSINRIENKAHIRALFFRVLTTIGIGLGIMFIYYIAQEFGINMPLMKVR